MEFNVAEIRFLRQEHATRGLRPIADLREIGCPEHIFAKILERRAAKLGGDFQKFRADVMTNLLGDDLAARIAAAKLF